MSAHPEFPTLLAFNGFEASILVDGKEVPHYGVECDEAKREFSCWIESKAGKPFAYQYKRIKPEYDCSAKTYLDGEYVEGTVISKEDGPNYSKHRPHVRISNSEVRNLSFASLELTDDDTYLENSSSLQNLGEIKIVFFQIRKTGEVPSSQRGKFARPLEPQTVHERSKKGLSHQIRCSETVQLKASQGKVFQVKYCGVLATFIFRYRPLAMLQANGIAPLDPIIPAPREESTPHTPPPLNKKRKLPEVKQELNEDQGDDEIDERERALLAELEKVRQERLVRNNASGPSKRVKQEPKTYFSPGEIIDLT